MKKPQKESEISKSDHQEHDENTVINSALMESELSYRSIFEHATDAIYIQDENGIFLDVNPAAMEMYGYRRDEMVGHSPDKLAAPGRNDMGKTLAHVKKAFNGEPQRFEWWGRRKNGEEFPKEVVLNSGRYFGKAVVVAMARDMTERFRVYEALRQSEDKYRSLTDQLPVGVYRTTIDGHLIYSNPALAKILCYDSMELLQLNVSQLYADPAERDKQLSESTASSAVTISEFQLKKKSGDLIWVKDNSRLLFDTFGSPLYFDGIIEDINEKKLAQIHLQYQSDLREMLIGLSTGFINLPLNEIEPEINKSLIKIGEFVNADRAYVFDYDPVNNTCTNTFEWCREGIEPQIDKMQEVRLTEFSEWAELHKRGEIVKADDILEMPHGELRRLMEDQDIISLLTIPLISEGTYIGFVGFDSVRQKHIYSEYEQQLLQVYAQMLVNARERMKQEQRLVSAKEKAEESDRLKSAFLANMSHEIRTPMNGIIGFMDLLKEPELSDENKNAYIDIVIKSGMRLLDTINDIIEISKIETGEIKIHKSPVNISELLGYYHGFFKQQTDQKNLNYTISNRLPEEIFSFLSDRNKLDSIISNLIKNAIKFTDYGSVEFGCEYDSGNIVFFVKDTGSGIPADRLNSVFDRFVQLDVSDSRPHEGSGLGLSIVRAYVEMLNGKINIISEPGKGSIFRVSLPYIPSGNNVNQAKGESIKSKPHPERKHLILVAEDDYPSYLFLEKLLSGEGISFIRTINGEETLETVRNNPDITMILMDIRLPGMNGIEVTRRIREFNKSVPVIAQTAYALRGDREQAISAGCNDYITKPVSRDDLARIVSKYTGPEI